MESNIDKQKYKVTAFTTESNAQVVKDYLREYGVENWEVLTVKNEDVQNAKLLVTPITVVANENGVVENVWVGMWHSKEIDAVNRFFSINLSQPEL